jgi:CCR4-NOT transcriptional regulation complex NOT5 subunit
LKYGLNSLAAWKYELGTRKAFKDVVMPFLKHITSLAVFNLKVRIFKKRISMIASTIRKKNRMDDARVKIITNMLIKELLRKLEEFEKELREKKLPKHQNGYTWLKTIKKRHLV